MRDSKMGKIRKFYEDVAPKSLRKRIDAAGKGDLLDLDYPYPKKIRTDDYEDEISDLHIELVKLQSWVKETGARVVIVFEGRDAAGKGGTIKRFRENLNPRGARVVALAKPSDQERGQWYFQRYIKHMPAEGEIVFFDRSWYNRAVVEKVFGFCTDAERELFFRQAPEFEDMMVNDGVYLFKLWLTIGRAEQLDRFLAREDSPLKQWKLSSIDYQALGKWDAYSKAIVEMFERTHTDIAPWTVIRSADKKRARIAAIRHVLSSIDYKGRTKDATRPADPAICGAPGDVPLAGD
ncbi:MAG: polyphosphate kinase 2 [Pseudomonadota bacterium]